MRYSWRQIEATYTLLIESIDGAPANARNYLVLFGDELKTNAQAIIDLIPLLKKHVPDKEYFIGLGHDVLFIANPDVKISSTIHISSWQTGIYEVTFENGESIERRKVGADKIVETLLEYLQKLR